MTDILPLVYKELRYYADSAIAWILGVLFLAVSSVVFFSGQHFIARDEASLRAYFSFFPFLMMLVLPALTMRSWAEEQRQGTLELLLSLPLPEWKLVFGKFLSPMLLFLILLIITMFVPLTVLPFGNFDIGIIVTEYLGLFFLASTTIAIGLWISSLTMNQVSAYLLSVSLLLALTIVNQVATLSAMPVWLADTINYLSFSWHVESFIKGLIDSRDIAYFLGLTLLFLFLNERHLTLRKWS